MEIIESIENDNNLSQNELDSRLSFFAMIADPIRHKILIELLFVPELSVNQLMVKLKKPQTLISYHLRCLRECGLLDSCQSDQDKRKSLYSLHDRKFIVDLYKLADNFLKTHEICRDHPSCRFKNK